MSELIVNLLNLSVWESIFSVSFFLGLIFTIYIIFGALSSSDSESESDVHGDHDFDADHDMDFDADHDMDFDADHDMDFDADHDMDFDADHDMDFDADHDMDLNADHDAFNLSGIQVDDIHDVGSPRDSSYELRSRFMMGNISVFLLFWGQTGWLAIDNLTDLSIILALITGIITSKLFALFISKYAKTVIVPLVRIQKGDIGEVSYSVSQKKPGLINVMKRDGSVEPVMAIGAYPHDNFFKGDKGYILGKENSFYIITRASGELRLKKVIPKNKTKII